MFRPFFWKHLQNAEPQRSQETPHAMPLPAAPHPPPPSPPRLGGSVPAPLTAALGAVPRRQPVVVGLPRLLQRVLRELPRRRRRRRRHPRSPPGSRRRRPPGTARPGPPLTASSPRREGGQRGPVMAAAPPACQRAARGGSVGTRRPSQKDVDVGFFPQGTVL